MGTFYDYAYQMVGLKGQQDTDGRWREIVETWMVRTQFAEPINVAVAAAGLPSNGDPHPVYAYLRVSDVRPDRQAGAQVWYIEIVYTQDPPPDAGGNFKLVLIEYGTHELQQDVTHNLGTGQVLVDANGKPFQQTISVPRSYPYIKIVKRELTVNRTEVITKSGTINDANVIVAGVTVPKWTGRIRIHATEVEQQLYNWDIQYEVLVRDFNLRNYINFAGNQVVGPDNVGWMEGVINQGYYFYDSASPSNLSRAVEKVTRTGGKVEERPAGAPILLDANGAPLAEGQEPLSILLQVYPESDWSTLGLNDLS